MSKKVLKILAMLFVVFSLVACNSVEDNKESTVMNETTEQEAATAGSEVSSGAGDNSSTGQETAGSEVSSEAGDNSLAGQETAGGETSSETNNNNEVQQDIPKEYPGMREITTQELVEDMGLGINLGNTFEATGSWIHNGSVSDYEVCWGSPIITEEMIKGYKEAGFGVIRVPANWTNMMSADYTLNADYVARVKQVVDWILENDMYVILNIHHETWIADMPNNEEECMKHYTRIWEQICEVFKDYDDYLMFESLNEEGGWDSVWNQYGPITESKAVAYGYLNNLNQTFVNIVRASGGNNEKRHLLLAGYYTNIERTCDEMFVVPEDPENRVAVSVHYYTPSTLTILEEDADWGKAKTTWGSDADLAELDSLMDLMKTTFVDKGVPVIVGEYGCFGKNKTQEVKRNFMVDVCREAYERNMCPILWDTQDTIYERNTCTYKDPLMLEQMMAILETVE